ncbi:MAG: HNH endonuclease [Bacteroidetes bacterium]|nr:HNH endonuclease [Bacteroidota bacterium]
MESKEIWKDVPGYEGIYQVSSMGMVKSLNYKRTGSCRLLKQTMLGEYLRVNLYKNGSLKTIHVHQLVAIVFKGHKPSGHKLVVNHKNFIKKDNRYKNLEIVSNRINSNRKHLISSSKYTGVNWNKSKNKWEAGIVVNGKKKYLGTFHDEMEASLAYEKEITKL